MGIRKDIENYLDSITASLKATEKTQKIGSVLFSLILDKAVVPVEETMTKEEREVIKVVNTVVSAAKYSIFRELCRTEDLLKVTIPIEMWEEKVREIKKVIQDDKGRAK